MKHRKDTEKRNVWICREFERLQKGKHPRHQGRKVEVNEALEIIRRELRKKKQFRCNRSLRKRTIYNIIYQE